MKLAELKRIPDSSGHAPVRGTEGQDAHIRQTGSSWRQRRWIIVAALCAAAIMLLVIWLAHSWLQSGHVVSAERLRIAPVSAGPFVRDVAAQGVVIAAVNPTLFAVAPGTVSYAVRAGDAVAKGKIVATLDSPALNNEYQRERATLDSLDAAMARQKIEIRRQILTSQQQSDLTKVSIQAAQREMKRAQWAWDQRAVSERDYQRAADDVTTAQLNFDHAKDTAALERDSLAMELKTRALERDRQALVVADLRQRVAELALRSPVDGMVANLAQAEKTRVAENAPLLTVVDLGAFEIEFAVAETYARSIKPGMAAQITLEGAPVAGTVTAISPEVRQNEVTGRVKFAAQPPGVRQNQRASVRIVLDERSRVLKFEHGPLIDEATRAVYVVRGDVATRVPVELGPASVAEIEALRGLTPGDQVIISDMRDFHDAPEVIIGR